MSQLQGVTYGENGKTMAQKQDIYTVLSRKITFHRNPNALLHPFVLKYKINIHGSVIITIFFLNGQWI
jgi:hypothetical protein